VAKRAGKAMKGADEAAEAVPAAKAAKVKGKSMTMSEKGKMAFDIGSKGIGGKSKKKRGARKSTKKPTQLENLQRFLQDDNVEFVIKPLPKGK
jgi:hypothetical protein